MSRNLFQNIRQGIAASFAPEVSSNNTLNQTHLSIATKGYWFQSHILKIPDRYGFFSPGPPRLQVHQGVSFLILFYMILICTIGNSFLALFMFMQEDHAPIAPVALGLEASLLIWVGIIWFAEYVAVSFIVWIEELGV